MEPVTSINRANLEYVESLYQTFLGNREDVEPQWRLFFDGVEFAQNVSAPGKQFSPQELAVYNLVEHYRDYGHLKANLDPLQLSPAAKESFDLAKFGLKATDLEQTFAVGALLGFEKSKLRDIVAFLETCYCQTLTAQVAECRQEVRDWFRQEFEKNPAGLALSAEERQEIFRQLARTESLEKFIHTRYVGTKRFSIEGGDALIPMLERGVSKGIALGVEEIVIGMAHRGRINVLANFMEKALGIIFSEFDGTAFENYDYDGDVKYHLGYSTDKKTTDGKSCHVSLAFNPSHLEVVNPVVTGMARAKQRRRDDTKERKKVLPITIHGDAAFAGQGVVSETMQMSQLPGYTVGGTIHIIVDNQVGFTTNPKDARSTRYSADVAKSIKAPVLLVNGDDVEACVRAMDIALRFRQQFGEDVVIDQICYRRFGHNEGDEPAFTQPVMYDAIKQHPTLMNIYLDKLQQTGTMTRAAGELFYKEKIDNLQVTLDETRKKRPDTKPNNFDGQWKGLRRGTIDDFDKPVATIAPRATLDKVAKVLTEEPKDFNIHPKISKLIEARKKMVETGHLDWAMGELLAYGSLCLEGSPVRLSGQDCKRGTFTHRQAVYSDIKTDAEFCPLSTLNPNKGEFAIYNSLLSEMAVLGFEYGNSCSDPTFLTIWEAQFGDFANGAQIVIDQFLCSGEEKWMRGTGLVLLLPHGYEGQGPEHSSARLERFLQLCAQANMQVCNFTTPANLFHALRRQIKRDFRKPLIVMSPKSLLRHPKVVSSWPEFTDQGFQEVLADPKTPDLKNVETLVLCTGKLYYDLDEAREKTYTASQSTAIVRVEQLYPLPHVQLTPFLNGLPKLNRLVWAQEEPRNMGAYSYIAPKLTALLSELGKKKLEVEYVGRSERASPAVGSIYMHQKEQQAIIEKVFKG